MGEQLESIGWFRWSPEKASHSVYRDIAAAIDNFEPVDCEAGHAAADWLKESAISDYPASATWLLYSEAKVEGFFAIRSGRFRMERSSGRLRSDGAKLKPASELTWMCKHNTAEIPGQTLIMRAAGIASRVSRSQGNIALVIDPYDKATAKVLSDKHAFLESSPSGQLWLPVGPSANPVRGE